VDWNAKRLAQYVRWKTRVKYNGLGRLVRVRYARFAYWLPVRNPDFLSIGAPRAASTWLYKRLALHPDVCLPKRKEIHFFDVQEGKGAYVYGPDARKPAFKPMDLGNPAHWRWYRSYFGRCDSNKLTGDFTPDYSLLDVDRIRVVKAHLPNLKLIYTMRDPVTRAWSSVRKELWWRFRMYPHEVPNVDTLVRMAMRPGVLARGDYASVIARWETFYRDQILYLFFDDILEHPQEALHRVCDFLGLDRSPLNAVGGHAARVNDVPGDGIPVEVRHALESYYTSQADVLVEKFGRSFSP
jgi:Sulfotransferase family